MIGIILTIVGIIISIGFGIYSIWSYRKSKRNISLEFQAKECYSLFKEDVNRLNIELIYKNQPLSNTLILLKAKLINNGQIDVDKNRIYNPLKIISKNEFHWLEATITSSPIGSTTNIALKSETEILLDWDLLKKDEYIEFEALVEIFSKDDSNLGKVLDFYNGLHFDFRITDLSKIQKERQVSEIQRRENRMDRTKKMFSFLMIVFGLFLILIGIFSPRGLFEKDIIKYQMTNGKKDLSAFIYIDKSEKVRLKIDSSKISPILSISEFNKSYNIKGIEQITYDSENMMTLLLVGIMYLVIGLMVFIQRRFSNKNKNRKMIEPLRLEL